MDNDLLRPTRIADEPDRRTHLRVALPGHQLEALLLQVLTNDLKCHVVQLGTA
jgi:hypothetical protein